jgi:hypothetical protein
MTHVLKSSFFRRFAGGFVLGTLGMFALQPAEATRMFSDHVVAPIAHQR